MTDRLLMSVIRHLNQLKEENNLRPEQIKAIAAFVAEITGASVEGCGEKMTPAEYCRLQERTIRILHDISAREHEANGYTV